MTQNRQYIIYVNDTLSDCSDVLDAFNKFSAIDKSVMTLNHAASEYPFLTVHNSDNMYALHFFPAVIHPGFQSVGTQNAINTALIEIQDGCLPNSVFVNKNDATSIILEFANSGNLPNCIKWHEL